MKQFFAWVLVLVLGAAAGALAAVNPDTAPSGMAFDSNRANGAYIVSVLKNSGWQEVGRLDMDRFFRQRDVEIDLSGVVASPVRLRLEKTGGGAAHVDSVALDGQVPVKANTDLGKIVKRDLDAIGVEGHALEMAFQVSPGTHTLQVAGRIEAETIPEYPFLFPLSNLFKEMTPESDFYTYSLNSKGEAPLFKAFSLCGSGHPSGYTYGWVSNDEKNLYVKMDFTPDNTMDGGKDYTAVFVKTKTGVRRFKVSEEERQWGAPEFTYTDKVDYQHKVYSFVIPLSDLGIASPKERKDLQMAFAAYGTAMPALNVTDSAGVTYPVYSYDGMLDSPMKDGFFQPRANFYALEVNAERYGSSASYAVEDSGREVDFSAVSLGGLQVKRKVYVPEESNFIRYLNILSNPSGDAITVDVKVSGALSALSSIQLYQTSSGDAVLAPEDSWMVTHGDSTILAFANIWDGPSGDDTIDSVNRVEGDFDWTWESVTVPAGETVIYMFFGVPQVDKETAAARAVAIGGLSDSSMLSGMSEEEKRQVRNWVLVDDDGISLGEENGAPNGGDGNNDGVPDSFQNHVTSMKTHDGASYVTVVASESTTLSACAAAPVAAENNPPSAVDFDHGSFSFTVNGVAAGGKTEVTLTLSEGVAPDTYYKYGPTPENAEDHWYEFLYDETTETGAKINGNVITLYLVDGERGDADLTANGVIVDPGAPGVKKSSGGGCFVKTATP
ncbi:hypothetical protein DSLASN_34450 [Desulfoluna limicola]|uniref:Uncharacterized protein n=1 Tax=Desulfoluna limicola TaxID=2810562 RepID=A0ABM7PKU2_9BACT|nr:choice-of-anchor U domain-containing protein [Desulfoluna limicola]BCS97813.1 hypothetical protein DSLASN_34450 [Desulfoluna limicola]